jgi:hypothetical protein
MPLDDRRAKAVATVAVREDHDARALGRVELAEGLEARAVRAGVLDDVAFRRDVEAPAERAVGCDRAREPGRATLAVVDAQLALQHQRDALA